VTVIRYGECICRRLVLVLGWAVLQVARGTA
jgi:hypothetical protein